MKKLFLIFSIFFSLNIFATGNTTMMPVSTQKVANATLTCPTGKWCRVLVSANQAWSGSSIYNTVQINSSPCNLKAEFILKSGETISGTVSNGSITAGNLTGSLGVGSVSISIGGVVVAKCQSTGVANSNQSAPSGTISSSGDYNFYSMEYWN